MRIMQIAPDRERATVTIPELAREFGIARSSAYELAKRDALPVPVIRLGRRLVVSRKLMERVLAGESVRLQPASSDGK
jgi:predicted DNA-binding transcriptional regulator AlpA